MVAHYLFLWLVYPRHHLVLRLVLLPVQIALAHDELTLLNLFLVAVIRPLLILLLFRVFAISFVPRAVRVLLLDLLL